MKRYLLAIPLMILLSVTFAYSWLTMGPTQPSTAEPQQEIGETTIAGTSESSSSNDFCTIVTVGATQLTVSHAYWYGNYNNTGNDLTFAVYDDDGGSPGSQVGSCSDGGDLPQSATEAWHERTWSSGDVVLAAATTYHICRYTDSGGDHFYTEPGGTKGYYDDIAEGGCPADMTTSTTRLELITVANYDVR